MWLAVAVDVVVTGVLEVGCAAVVEVEDGICDNDEG